MTAVEGPRTYFFDDDDVNTPFEFQSPTKFDAKALNSKPILQATFSRTVSGSLALQPGFYALLADKLLVYYKNEGNTKPEAVLNLAQARLKTISSNAQEGFSLTKNLGTHELFSDDKQVVDAWVHVLRTMCVLTNFHDEYKALKMIGRGSFAKVYLVESKLNGKSYAVKAFTKEGVIASNKVNAKPAMINEIDIMRILDHDHIIKLHEVYETEKSIYLVLDLIQGKSLQDTIKKSTFKDDYSDVKVFNIIRSILDALGYLASKGIMHRDLKPDNILLENGDKVKIVDFGLATFVDVPEYIFKKCGTPGYIAPEVFKYDQKEASTNYDDRCDVFSAGSIFFYLLFGKPFFEGSNGSEILKSNRKFAADSTLFDPIKQSLQSSDGKISKDALDLLLKLLEFGKSKRISANDALNHPYFTPFPTGMTRIGGSNDFTCEALSKYNQNGFYSSIIKRDSSATDSPLIPSKPFAAPTETNSPGLKPRDRFAERGSLYLDMGRPDLNGRVDTLAGQSTNNSMWLNQNQREQTINNSPSSFAKTSFVMDQRNRPSNRSFRNSTVGPNQLLKAALHRNMQKNSEQTTEDHKEDSMPHLRGDRRFSEVMNVKRGSLSIKTKNPSDDDKHKSAENSPTSSPDASPMAASGNDYKYYNTPTSPMRRFQPFAQK